MIFNFGDLVKCKLGGPKMMITSAGPQGAQLNMPGFNPDTWNYTCTWFNEKTNAFNQWNLPGGVLEASLDS